MQLGLLGGGASNRILVCYRKSICLFYGTAVFILENFSKTTSKLQIIFYFNKYMYTCFSGKFTLKT